MSSIIHTIIGMSTARWRLKSPLSISRTSTDLNMATVMVMNDRFTRLSFHPCQLVLPSLIYNCFRIYVGKSKVKFKGEVRDKGHIIDRVHFNFQFVLFLFSFMSIGPTIPKLWSLMCLILQNAHSKLWKKCPGSSSPQDLPLHFPMPIPLSSKICYAKLKRF